MTRSGWIVRPEHFLRYLARTRGLRASDVRIPSRLVLVFGGQDWRAFRRLFRASPLEWHEWLLVGRAGRRPVGVLRTTIGAPAAAIALEEAGVLGARAVVAFGSCGSLVRDLHIGALVVPTRAYADEGTSRHYATARWLRPDLDLVDAIRAGCRRRSLPFREGGTWTTDAPYRESLGTARLLSKRGVVAVEMEASALWATARGRGMRAASLFVVSDELGGDGWNPGFYDPLFRRGKRDAIRVIEDVMSRDLT